MADIEDVKCDICGELNEDCNCTTCSNCDRKSESMCECCEHCDRCCTCVTCAGRRCGKRMESVCPTCERCGNCCECYSCNNCGNRVESVCGECEMCEDCGCSCESQDAGPRYSQHFKIHKPASLNGYQQNKLRRPISIELELSEVSSPDTLVMWARQTGSGLVEDGSIPDEGCEINTNPLAGDLFPVSMDNLANVLKRSGASVNSSCGLHAHIDASDYSQFDLRRLVMVWTMVERTMFDLAGKSRICNQYCKPSALDYAALLAERNPKKWRAGVTRALYNGEANAAIRSHKHNKYHPSRYYALNLHSFFFRKTVEFRLHEARTEAHIIRNWPLVCGHIVEYAMRSTEKQLIALLRSTQSSGEILASILPAELNQWTQEQLASRYAARKQYGTFAEVESVLRSLDTARESLKEKENSLCAA